MKNLKNMFMVSGLMAVIMLGASTANAGIIIIAKANQDVQTTAQCTEEATTFLQKIGIVLTDLSRALIGGDASESDRNCNGNGSADNSKQGLLVTDNSRKGLLVSD